MLSKLMRDHFLGGSCWETLTPKSLKGAPSSSKSKGKRPTSSFSPEFLVGCSTKKFHTGSLGAPSSRPSPGPLPPPPLKDERDTPLKSSLISSNYLHNRQSLDQERGKYPLVANLRRGGGGSFPTVINIFWDPSLGKNLRGQRLHVCSRYFPLVAFFSPQGVILMFCIFSIGGFHMRGTFSKFHGAPPIPSTDAQRQKLEDKVERLGSENAKLIEARKEATSHCLQLERDLKTLQNRLKEFKKSQGYQEEVAKIVGLYFEHGFLDCKEQFQAQGYPPSREKPTFLNLATALYNALDPYVEPPIPKNGSPSIDSEGDLDRLLGEVEAEVRSPLIKATIDSIIGHIHGESAPESKEGDALLVADVELPTTSMNAPSSQTEQEKEDLACEEKNDDVA
ncbi:UNVERIFIED_CONTAM: hypothetical protein Sindi_2300000 [Sesamum indicum]